jgi:hypothetical protein
MKRILLSLPVAAFAVLLVASRAGVADGGSLWPFSSTSSTPAAKPAPASKSPSMLSKLSTGTKKLWKSTKNALTPKSAPTKTSIQPTNPYIANKQPPQKHWYDGLLAKKTPPPKPKTPSDWIALPRPN